jgi:hypothetical protein
LESNLQLAIVAVNAVAWLLVVGIDMGEPADSTTFHVLEIDTVRVEKIVIVLENGISQSIVSVASNELDTNLFVLDVGHGIGAIWLDSLGCHGWPTILLCISFGIL